MIANRPAYQARCDVTRCDVTRCDVNVLSFFFFDVTWTWPGCYNNSIFEASWQVDPSRRIVNITLRTTRTGNWLGFGISTDRGMVSGDCHIRKKLNGVANSYCHLSHQCWILNSRWIFRFRHQNWTHVVGQSSVLLSLTCAWEWVSFQPISCLFKSKFLFGCVSRRTVTSSLDFWTVHVFKLTIGKTSELCPMFMTVL